MKRAGAFAVLVAAVACIPLLPKQPANDPSPADCQAMYERERLAAKAIAEQITAEQAAFEARRGVMSQAERERFIERASELQAEFQKHVDSSMWALRLLEAAKEAEL